ncbi:hypothetical protein AO385_1807 [Moraxella catarrhalis]|uniref:Uncharacterized protein n=1 Tax=Moraxella catarrhalis TaxID=480 RepID=A0A198ULD6_MORCA|nr:hypothetical protein AO385_1807 [Moraxella catarrhalis]OAU97293.1 hypothetical protein AO384_0675 [Moraxella catarrhalis]OAU98554.1 hypothetical protein AO383_0620 [Moraxella catarrhalis]
MILKNFASGKVFVLEGGESFADPKGWINKKPADDTSRFGLQFKLIIVKLIIFQK